MSDRDDGAPPVSTIPAPLGSRWSVSPLEHLSGGARSPCVATVDRFSNKLGELAAAVMRFDLVLGGKPANEVTTPSGESTIREFCNALFQLVQTSDSDVGEPLLSAPEFDGWATSAEMARKAHAVEGLLQAIEKKVCGGTVSPGDGLIWRCGKTEAWWAPFMSDDDELRQLIEVRPDLFEVMSNSTILEAHERDAAKLAAEVDPRSLVDRFLRDDFENRLQRDTLAIVALERARRPFDSARPKELLLEGEPIEWRVIRRSPKYLWPVLDESPGCRRCVDRLLHYSNWFQDRAEDVEKESQQTSASTSETSGKEKAARRAFADRIRIVDNPEAEQAWSDRFRKLSGFDWPPKNAAEWTVVLTRAGFSEKRLEQFLETTGMCETLGVGELPEDYLSAGGDSWPIFSARLVTGLERWRENSPAAPKVLAQVASEDPAEPSSKRGNGSEAASACVARSPSGRVQLFEWEENPVVDGQKVKTLTKAKYRVVLELLKAGQTGLTKDQLDRQCDDSADSYKHVAELKKLDRWNEVVVTPGKARQGGYRIL